VRHSDFDGVTNGEWWWGTSFPSASIQPKTPSVRRLIRILSPVQRGRPFTQIKVIPEGIFDTVRWVQDLCYPGGFFPARHPQTLVLAPSVFTRWTTRHLTVKELFECWDIPPCLIMQFGSVTPRDYGKLPFILSPPSKVLHGVLLSIKESVVRAHVDLPKSEDPGDPRARAVPLLEVRTQGDVPKSENRYDSHLKTLASLQDLLFDLEEGPSRQRAAKDDDAVIPTHLWDILFWNHFLELGRTPEFILTAHKRLVGSLDVPILDVLCQFVLRVWWHPVFYSFCRYMRLTHGPAWWSSRSPDLAAGRDCITCITDSTFWDWEGGSRLLFWCWLSVIKTWARDGHPIYISGTLPQYRRKQGCDLNATRQGQVQQKLEKIVRRGYVQKGTVRSLISFFTVPKGDSDVCVVFDETRSGLNNAIWVPSFHLPTINSLLSSLEPGYWQSDINVGEQFYNFGLDPRLQPYCGLDVTHYMDRPPGVALWLLWVRCVIGLKSSPHGCVKMQSLVEELLRGNPRDSKNPFYFDQVLLNLPGSPSYDPHVVRARKFDSRHNKTAGDMLTYVDDTRTTGRSAGHCWDVSHQVGTCLSYLGIQDALRKHTAPSQRAGAWTGSLAQTPSMAIIVSCTQEKWTRARSYVEEMYSIWQQGERFSHKDLECKCGFLVYVTRTYPSLVPFLKGIHLTLDSCRPGRDQEGWKLQGQVAAHFEIDLPSSLDPPVHVQGMPRLGSDLSSLLSLMSSTSPPERVIRSSSVMMAIYGFGDASGMGFGSTMVGPSGTQYRYGIWGNDLTGATSSYRELFNLTEAAEVHVQNLEFPHLQSLVDSLSQEAAFRPLRGCEFYLFTDNAVAEAAFFKGTSSNPRLFSLILRLKQLALNHSLSLHIIHISGHHM
jgi:hypothetical protein